MPLPLAEGPSGGELSRLALTLASVISEGDCATLVLDEVDTGISGEAAARVGEVLAAMGRTRQVLVITHRAEIAARADRHIVVKRADDDGKATSRVALVDGRERREEIARLMSGGVTPAALERADELLREAITAAA
ncbi:MAG TPA: DNA repair protein RecN, partial [Candidatus Sulfotelmatobacter sp.]|nr:DNA repair protein RecN [Candidatus Sulfotelmatobacter sp.]